MGVYQKYCQTRNELYFEKMYYKMQYLIRKKIRSFGIRGAEIEDAKQEVFREIYIAADKYNPDIKNEDGFCMIIAGRAIMNYLTTKNRKKHKFLNEAYSLDKEIDDAEDDGTEYYEKMASDYSLENEIIARDEIKRYYSKIKNNLTRMELEIWKADIITQSPDKCKWSDIEEITRMTGYGKKQVDNALQRIRGKIEKIRGEIDAN